MNRSKFLTAATCLLCSLPSFAQSPYGASYLSDTGTLIFGGLDFWAISKNLEDRRSIYVKSPGMAQRKILRQFEGNIMNLRVAPQGRWVAVTEATIERNVPAESANYKESVLDAEGSREDVPSRLVSRLIVLDLDGRVVTRVEDVFQYSWSPTGDKIAYITGGYAERGPGFNSTGVWILDLATMRSSKILEGGEDLEWAIWDNNIYIDVSIGGGPVLGYSPAGGQSFITSHKGIRFSPDGLYYIRNGGDGEIGGEVFETRTDRQIELAPIERRNEPSRAVAVDWVGASTVALRTGGSMESRFLQDLKTGERVSVNGYALAMPRRSRAIVFQNGDFKELAVPLQ